MSHPQPQPHAHRVFHRPLTAGEIAMASSVFGQAIDYRKVKVHGCGYWLLCGLQPAHTAVCPNGHMYFPSAVHQADFSQATLAEQSWFMHELTHVWQYQMGYWVKCARILRPRMSYAYTVGTGRAFRDFNMEAQGNLVEDHFLTHLRGAQGAIRERRYRSDPSYPQALTALMADFLQAPADRRHLPRTFA